MTILKYANNAKSTLQSSINATQSTAVLVTGTGSLFPNPGTGQSFYLTFTDAATQLITEIVLVTARSGDALTIVRGQDGTSAMAWDAGDIAAQLVTAADMNQCLQPDQLQEGLYDFGGTAGGTANSLTAIVPSQLATIPDGFDLIVRASYANTGNTTITLTMGSTVQSAVPILKGAGSQLNPNDIPGAGFPMLLIFSAASNAFFMTNPASGTAGSVNGGVANQILYQTAPNTTGFLTAPTVVGSVLSWVGGVIQWIAAAVTSFNGRSGAVVPGSSDYTAAMVGAVSTSSVTGANQQIAQNGFQTLPGGIIIQWGFFTPFANNSGVTFPKTFPNACFMVVPTGYTNNSASVTNPQAYGYQGVSPCASFNLLALADERPIMWFAIGY